MLIGGLPHGAFDIAIAQAALRLKWQIAALIFGAYIGVAGLMLGLWHISPISALALFLAFSAIHFGDDWDMLDNGLLRTMAGASVICVAAFFNPAAVSDLFLAMAGPGAEWIQRILVAIAPVAILVTIVGIWQAVKAGSRADLRVYWPCLFSAASRLFDLFCVSAFAAAHARNGAPAAAMVAAGAMALWRRYLCELLYRCLYFCARLFLGGSHEDVIRRLPNSLCCGGAPFIIVPIP
jgi:Brp/Blh family beta-carotene 15,15'-monooxygenase